MKTEAKVGIFVFISLIVVAALLLSFSKGRALFTPIYELKLSTGNVGGIKRKASVAMLGVEIGTVSSVKIDPDGRNVTVILEINAKYKIRKDARFTIEQSGFLGDQYISIQPGPSQEDNFLQPGDVVTTDEPFNILEMARSASGLLEKIDNAAKVFNNMMDRVDRLVLNEETLTNLSVTVKNLRQASDKVNLAIEDIRGIIQTNSPGLAQAVTNLTSVSTKIDTIADDVNKLIAENKTTLSSSLKNFEELSADAKGLVKEVREGKGVVSDLIKNEEIKVELRGILSNLQVASSNIANYGLLFKPKKPKRTTQKSEPVYQGRSPFKR